MKKIIASFLVVFFMLLSPFSAFASTSESIVQLVPIQLSSKVIEYNPSDSIDILDSGISLMSVTPEEVLDGILSVETKLYTVLNGVQNNSLRALLITAFNPPLTQATSNSLSNSSYNAWASSKDYYSLVSSFSVSSGSEIVSANCGFSMDFSGLYTFAVRQFIYPAGYYGYFNSNVVPSDIIGVYATLWNSDKSDSVVLDISSSILSSGNKFGFSNSFSPVDFDVYYIDIEFRISSNAYTSFTSDNPNGRWDNYISFNIGFDNAIVSFDIEDESVGLIKGIIEWLKSIRDGITGVFDAIVDLPNKIQDMLIGLIVPDSDTMASKYSEFSELLEEKLGVIYQIPMMLFDFFDTIVNAATTPQSSLTLPAFTLPWIDGSTLTVWNSMEYKIIPDGLEVLSDLIKTVTSMTVVVLTFNSVKRAYERFLRS